MEEEGQTEPVFEEPAMIAPDETIRRPWRFRSYRPGDLEAMVELDAACFEGPFRFSREAMRRFVEAENAWVIVATDRKQLTGFCVVHREKTDGADVGYLVTIDVDERRRRHGIGRKMLSDAEMWVRSWNGAGILLHVFLKNKRAVEFYEELKYRRVDVQQGFYGPGLDAAMYWKDFRLIVGEGV